MASAWSRLRRIWRDPLCRKRNGSEEKYERPASNGHRPATPRRLGERAFGLGLVHVHCKTAHDGSGDLILDGKDVLELAVVALGPAVRAGHGVDELGMMRMRSPARRMLPSST